jgi:23S rRNA (adenine2503-C2)-methyltransferase
MPGAKGTASLTHGRAVWRWLRETGLPETWPGTLPDAGRHALAQLQQHVTLPDVRVEEMLRSTDGTLKWRLGARGLALETVLIPNPSRSTVCISSQSGCTRYCDFCATARMGFAGQLTAGEMVAQVLLARAHAPSEAPVTNVVFMGMGEPLDNLEEVLAAVEVLEHGLSLGPRHVTISTSGVLPGMATFVEKSRACLALSLHATTNELRTTLMPRVARWPLEALTEFMRDTSRRQPGRHFFIEYILLKDLNDSLADAERLVQLMEGVRARINLLPFNSVDDARYVRPSDDTVRAFQARVVQGGLLCITRETRGQDAAAACGQLVVLGAR